MVPLGRHRACIISTFDATSYHMMQYNNSTTTDTRLEQNREGDFVPVLPTAPHTHVGFGEHWQCILHQAQWIAGIPATNDHCTAVSLPHTISHGATHFAALHRREVYQTKMLAVSHTLPSYTHLVTLYTHTRKTIRNYPVYTAHNVAAALAKSTKNTLNTTIGHTLNHLLLQQSLGSPYIHTYIHTRQPFLDCTEIKATLANRAFQQCPAMDLDSTCSPSVYNVMHTLNFIRF